MFAQNGTPVHERQPHNIEPPGRKSNWINEPPTDDRTGQKPSRSLNSPLMLAADTSHSDLLPAGLPVALEQFVPDELRSLDDVQTAIPRIARDERLIRLIETAVRTIPSRHRVVQGDSRRLDALPEDAIQLVVTSPAGVSGMRPAAQWRKKSV